MQLSVLMHNFKIKQNNQYIALLGETFRVIVEVENFLGISNKELRNAVIFVSDISLDMPDEIDISHLRAKGLQPGEEELPEQQQEQPGENSKYNVGESCCSQFPTNS